MNNILKTLDEFFLDNEVKNAFEAQDELVKYRRKTNTSFKEFLVEFNLKVNKVKLSGTELSDGVLGYMLLNCANLSAEKENMIRATCNKLDVKSVKSQLEKIALDISSDTKSSYTAVKPDTPMSSSIKVENVFYQDPHYLNNNDSSDDGISDQCDSYYGYNSNGRKYKINHKDKFQLNPLDKYGHVSQCEHCHCIYHWLFDCPYAPDHVKRRNNRRNGGTRSFNNSGYKKPL